MKIQPSIYLAIGLVAGGTILSACGKSKKETHNSSRYRNSR